MVLLRCLKRSSRMALQWSQLRVQWGRRTSSRGLTALRGDVDAEESLTHPPPPPSTGNDRDIPVGPVDGPLAMVVPDALWMLSLIGGGASTCCRRFWRTVERRVVGWSTPPPPLRNRCSCAKSRPPEETAENFPYEAKNLRISGGT